MPLWSRVRVDVLRFRKPPAQSVQRQIKTTDVTAIEHIEAGPFFALLVLNHRSTRGAAPRHPSIVVGGVNRNFGAFTVSKTLQNSRALRST
jgi:hypothetical protein